MEGEAKPAVAAGAGRTRTRLVRVDQKIIDFMLRQPPARPLPAIFSDEVLDRLGTPGHRALMASTAATMKRVNDLEADILHQYSTKGYAEVEEPLSDEDDEEEVAAMPEKKKKKKNKQQQKEKKKKKAICTRHTLNPSSKKNIPS